MLNSVNCPIAPEAIGPYSHATLTENLVFVSGQLPVHPGTGEVPSRVEDQTRQSLENLKAILETAGSSLNHVLKVTVFIKNMGDFAAINGVYNTFFAAPYPARSCVEVARLPKDVLVEIEAIGHINKTD